jgi:hypothetical protein
MIIQSIVISEGRVALSYDSFLTNVVVTLLWCVCIFRAARLRRARSAVARARPDL